MHALPFLVSTTCALALAPTLLRALARAGHTVANYRGRQLPFPFGLLILAAALAAGVPLVLLARLGHLALFHPEVAPILLYATGVICLGLIDDVAAYGSAGAGAPRGLRGHAAAALRGEPSSGVLKALGAPALALIALGMLGLSEGRLLLAAGVLVLCTHVFNLLDLRPGRAAKAFVLLGAALTAGSANVRPLWSLGLLGGPALVAGGYDVRERSMLGDTGASLVGALAGLWLVLTLGATAQLGAFALLVTIALYGEFRSISRLFERMPGLRGLDSLGRPS